MRGRGLIIFLHWSVALLLLAMIKGGSAAPALRWTFVGLGALWVGRALVRGLAGRPGPKLQGPLRAAYPWLHRGMYALVGVAAMLNAGALLGLVPLTVAWNSLLVLLVASIFHAIFHLWRHTALNDGALRMMTPRIWHKYL